MNLCELFLVILLVLIDGCFLLDTYLVIVLCVIFVYVLVLTKFPWIFGWVLDLRFVHFDTVFENFSLCTSCGPINSFLNSFDGILPILLLGVDESEALWGKKRSFGRGKRWDKGWDWWEGETLWELFVSRESWGNWRRFFFFIIIFFEVIKIIL